METYKVRVTQKRCARYVGREPIVRNNNDLVVEFEFDTGSGYTAGVKTAVFVTSRGKQERQFIGNTCVVPLMSEEDGSCVKVGVIEGSIKTTSKAIIPIVDDITTDAGDDVDAIDPDLPIADSLSLQDHIKVWIAQSGATKSASLATLADLIGGGSASDSLYPVEIGVTSLDEIAEAVTEGKLPVVFSATLIYFYSEIENGVAHFITPYGYNDYGDTGGGLNCLDYDGTDATTFEVELATTDDLNSYYIKPVAGIPKSDLASGVQSSLNKADAAVRYNAQTLTDAQKTQARENIGAASLDDIGTVFTIKGDVATVADLPTTGNAVGDVWYVQSVSAGYVWLETTEHPSGYWEELGEPIDLSAYRTAADQDVIDAAKADKPFTVAFAQDANESWSMTTNYADWTAAKNAGRELWLSLTFANASTVLIKSYLGQMAFAGVTYAAFGTTLPAVTFGNLSTMRGNLIVFGFVDNAQMYNATIFESVVLARESDLAAKQDTATEVTNASSGAVSQACEDNSIYTFTGALTSLTLTEASGAREYIVIFTTGSTAPTVTPPPGVIFPDGTNTFTAKANTHYEISVRNGYALYGSWAVS